MAFVKQEILDEIREKADLVEIIGAYIPLKKAGRNFRALCPFHHEKTPSFIVSADKQIFHCFGCGEGGNVFDFIMKHERLNFPEALEAVAGKIGFNIPREKDSLEKKESSLINKLFSANELAALFYSQNLLKSAPAETARQYLKKRGVNEQTITEFRLGFSLPQWQGFIDYAGKRGFSVQILEKAGLAIKGKDDKYYDRFRNKLMFPIANAQGKIIGFGSRKFDEEEGPKYINSPETEIYTKRKTLYGLNLAKRNIVKNQTAVITEGYFDVIIPYQAGFKDIVASLGTAFTNEHARILKRYTKEVILLFDADSSGEAAALRGLDILTEEGLTVKVCALPKGYDADELVRRKGKEFLEEVIKNAKDLFEYKLDLLKLKYPLKSASNKEKISVELLPTIKRIESSVLKSAYVKRLAQEIDVSEEALLDELKKVNLRQPSDYTKQELSVLKAKILPAEKMLLKLMLEDPVLIVKVKKELGSCDFENQLARKIVLCLFELDGAVVKNAGSALIDRVEDEAAKHLISEILADNLEIIDKPRCVSDCVGFIKKNKMKNKLKQLELQIKYVESVNDEQKRDYLSKEFQLVLKEYSHLQAK